MKVLLPIFLMLLTTACSESVEKQLAGLEIAKIKWSKHIDKYDYSYTYKRNCFCTLSGKIILVKVKNDKIVSATSEGKILSTVSFLTINEHFAQIAGLLDEKKEGTISIKVTYDAKYGFPTVIATKQKPFTLDGVVKESILHVSIESQ